MEYDFSKDAACPNCDKNAKAELPIGAKFVPCKKCEMDIIAKMKELKK